MAISTYKTYLMYKAGSSSSYTKLCDISSFPDLGGDPQTIEVTSLSDSMQRFIPGIKQNSNMSFDSYYDHATYATLAALEGTEQHLAIWFGATGDDSSATPDGSNGKFTFDGFVSVRVGGAGVNAAVPMTITVVPTTVITDATSA